jgi:hypothetical protein
MGKKLNLADAAEILARQKLGESDEWKVYKWDMRNAQGGHGGDMTKIIVTGAVPVGVYTKGEAAGHPIWKGKGSKVTLPIADVRALMEASKGDE